MTSTKTSILLLVLLINTCCTHPRYLHAVQKPIIPASAYNHDKFNTEPKDIIKEFRAFVTSFDSPDDDDNDGKADILGIPEFVAYEIKRYDGDCIPTKDRPKWFADPKLISDGIAPKDDSYKYSKEWRKDHPNWYERGHLAMKLIAERLGHDAAHNTHTLLNAVPQRKKFNRGIWLDMEYLTAAWAQRYGAVWVITGPVFNDGTPNEWIGEAEKGELLVAVPDALFKIVIKVRKGSKTPDVLAFVYPQSDSYKKKPYNHLQYLRSVDDVERLTGLDFLTSLPNEIENKVESVIASGLWEVDKDDFIKACR